MLSVTLFHERDADIQSAQKMKCSLHVLSSHSAARNLVSIYCRYFHRTELRCVSFLLLKLSFIDQSAIVLYPLAAAVIELKVEVVRRARRPAAINMIILRQREQTNVWEILVAIDIDISGWQRTGARRRESEPRKEQIERMNTSIILLIPCGCKWMPNGWTETMPK